jgi:hypothetical protein
LPDPYTIADFNITGTTLILESGFAIKQSGSDTLINLEYPPQFIKPGEIVMRKKHGPDYKLYLGEFDTTALNAFPPLHVFEIPRWSSSGQIMWYRIYNSPASSRNLDEEIVFFDNERIYLQHHKTIYYSRNDQWDTLHSTNKIIFGALSIESEPQGADIYIYGKSTGQKTPALIKNLIAGRYEIELFLPEYNFQRKTLTVRAGEVTPSSFEIISGLEPILVLGENQHGILVLPYPPIESVYTINGIPETSLKKPLIQGEYHIRWRGGGLYKSIDTMINIEAGKMVYFNVPFVRLAGKAVFDLNPKTALLCVEGFPCRWGDISANLSVELPSGFHAARISRHGYKPQRRNFSVSHDKVSLVKVALELNDDRDGDGFPDSVDKCPDVYGLYDGCPKPMFRNMVKIKAEEINEYIDTEPVSFAVSAMGLISRSPTNRRFNNFLSSFSGGGGGGLNNYQGLTLGNIYQVAFRGFIAQAELGQWSAGIKFRRPDTLSIKTDYGEYLVWHDSVYQVDPAIFIPSTALSGGFKYRIRNYHISYSVGYQWEDIIIDEVERLSDGEFTRINFNNNWWFHELMFEWDLYTDMFFTPALYAKFKIPFGPTKRTKWNAFNFGLNMRFRPSNLKSLQRGKY